MIEGASLSHRVRLWLAARPWIGGALEFVLPFVLTALVYRAQRPFVGRLIEWAGGVRVQEPHAFDLRFFGIGDALRRLTPNQWLQSHTHVALDLLCGVFYLGFIPFFAAIALVWRCGRHAQAARRMLWAFFFVNVAGYATYYVYPAAPPWYVTLYGLGPARMATPPSAGGALRFDAALGVDWFAQMYSHGESVFGAVPSLHNAYPMLALVFAFAIGHLRSVALIYVVGMAFSALYLNHHYILDIVWGWAYALLIGGIVLASFPLSETRTNGAAES